MKIGVVCVALSLALAASVSAKPPKGKQGKAGAHAAASPAAAVVNPADLPSANLTRFISAHLPALSNLNPDGQAACTAYRTDLSLIRAAFQGQAGVPEKKSAAEAGLRICDLLANAVEEHDKTAASVASSQTVDGVHDVKDVRVSTARARHGYGRATRANNAKEMAKNSQPGTNEAFINSAAANAWTTRLGQLRQQIDNAYAQELAIEQQGAGKPATTH